MYAVIRSGGKQYRVAPGETVEVERLEGKVGGKVTFDNVIAVSNDDKKLISGGDIAKAKVVRQDRFPGPRQESESAEVQDGRPIQNSDRPSPELHGR